MASKPAFAIVLLLLELEAVEAFFEDDDVLLLDEVAAFLDETLPAFVLDAPPRGKETVTSAVCFSVTVTCISENDTLTESPLSASSGILSEVIAMFSHVSPFVEYVTSSL